MLKLLVGVWLAFVYMTGLACAATLLPPGEQVFLDNNGAPLAAGQVFFYIPNTTTPKATYLNSAQTASNTNPVLLDAAGRAIIYGAGVYREVVKDSAGNIIWDQITTDTSANNQVFAGTSTGTANGQILNAPNFTSANGQAVSFIAGLTNTGQTFITVNGSALAVYKDTAAGPVLLQGGEIHQGNFVTVTYDSTLGAFHLLVPVSNQTFSPLTAATTTDLGSASTNNVDISGSANISSFGSSANTYNPLFVVTFEGSETLINSPALILPGGRNIVTSSGDSLTAKYLGSGNWRVLSYNSGSATQVIVSVGAYGASGSGQTTTGSIGATTTTLTLTGPIDLQNGQGIRIDGAGPAFSLGQPVSPSVTPQGTTGSTSYTYALASIDTAGGLSSAVTVTTTTGNASLGIANYNQISTTVASSSPGYMVWRKVGTGQYQWIGQSNSNTFYDAGFTPNWLPDAIPASPPTQSQSDWLVTKIVSGGGTSSLTLANSAGTTVTGANVFHSDTSALNAAIAAVSTGTGGVLTFPCGTFNIESTTAAPMLSVSYGGVVLQGSGDCTKLQGFGAGRDVSFAGANFSAFIYGNAFTNFYQPEYNKTAGETLYVAFASRFNYFNTEVDHPPLGVYFFDVNDVRTDHNRVFALWGSGAIGFRFESDSANSACCLYGNDFYITGNNGGGTRSGGGGKDKIGYYINGNAATLYTDGYAVSNMEGKGLQIINNAGNPVVPQFIQFVKFSSEYSNDRGADIEAGQDMQFHESTIAGSWGSASNVYIANAASSIEFIGGKIANAGCNGFDLYGSYIRLQGLNIANNSATNAGGTTSTCSGVVAEASASNFTITSNNIGSYFVTAWAQALPIALVAGSNHYTVTDNVFTGNTSNTPFNPDGTGSTRVIANNAQ